MILKNYTISKRETSENFVSSQDQKFY